MLTICVLTYVNGTRVYAFKNDPTFDRIKQEAIAQGAPLENEDWDDLQVNPFGQECDPDGWATHDQSVRLTLYRVNPV